MNLGADGHIWNLASRTLRRSLGLDGSRKCVSVLRTPPHGEYPRIVERATTGSLRPRSRSDTHGGAETTARGLHTCTRSPRRLNGIAEGRRRGGMC